MTKGPTSILAVGDWLRARADFRGIPDDAGQRAYLLGMAEALLAEAYTEIERLERVAGAR